jgi:hypothetical protein
LIVISEVIHLLNQDLIFRYCFILIFVFPKNGLALTEIDQFLSLAQRDISVLQSQGLRDSHLQQEASSAWLDDVELRLNYNEVEFDKGEYALRFRPKPISQMESETRMYQLEGKLNGIEYLNVLNEALRERYRVLIKIFHQNQLIALSERWVRLLEAKVEAYRELAGSEQFKLLDLIDAERQLGKRTLSHLEYQHSYEDMLYEFEIDSLLRELIVRGDWLCTPADVIEYARVEMDISSHGKSNSLLQGKEYAIQLAEQEYSFQRNKSGLSFSFLQFGYDFDNVKSGGFSLAAAFKIPLPGGEQRSVSQSRLRLLSAKNEKINLQQQLKLEIGRLRQELLHAFDKSVVINQEFRRGSNYVHKSEANIISPLVLIEVKENNASQEEQLILTRQMLYLTYIDLMHLSGNINKFPLRNLLDKQLGKLE